MENGRRRLIDQDWRFIKGDPPGNTVSLLYDVRPQTPARGAPPPLPEPPVDLVKSWILPTGNDFVKDPGKRARQFVDLLEPLSRAAKTGAKK
jgi:beta-galactosidase